MGWFERFKLPEAQMIKDLDAPATTVLHRKIIKEKIFLRKLYEEFYRQYLAGSHPDHSLNQILEIGSGGGFLKDIVPAAITSDIIKVPGIDLHCSAYALPFKERTLDRICMIDVLHHLGEPRKFFNEVSRCLRPSGKLIMIEPAHTPFCRFVYNRIRHESCEPNASWEFASKGPLTSANRALSWIIFDRDHDIFRKEYPGLIVKRKLIHTPFRYLLSGGLSYQPFVPSWTYPLIQCLEFVLKPLNFLLGMFITIIIEKHQSDETSATKP